jgi:hypothetical protein
MESSYVCRRRIEERSRVEVVEASPLERGEKLCMTLLWPLNPSA